ncbi:MAG: FHA domain-containing protein [bacterium]|nr:FHA domain-containing protein [bacterium]
MARYSFMTLVAAIICVHLAVTPIVAADDLATPVVVAVDTSRSLSTQELAATAAVANEVVVDLPAGSPVGLMAFDDEPNWIVAPEGSASEVSVALSSLSPSGSFTLLNDALFSAARALPDGGVVLLITDGRDENSATTVEDVAGLCSTNHVRIVALSVGRQVDELALRRLALLTDGAYLGRSDRAGSAEIGGAVEAARRACAADVAAAETAALSVVDEALAVSSAGGGDAVPATVVREAPWWLFPLLVVLTIAVLATPILLWYWRRGQMATVAVGEKDWDTDPAFVPVSADGVADLLDSSDEMPPGAPMAEEPDELMLDPSAYERLPFEGDIDKTSVLDERHVLILKLKGQPPRTFRLQDDRAFAVGRAPSVNTLTLEEKTLSGQHFKVVPHEGGYVAVDLESTNGTLVNGQKIRARRLESGDRIRAGEVECEFRIMLKPLG